MLAFRIHHLCLCSYPSIQVHCLRIDPKCLYLYRSNITGRYETRRYELVSVQSHVCYPHLHPSIDMKASMCRHRSEALHLDRFEDIDPEPFLTDINPSISRACELRLTRNLKCSFSKPCSSFPIDPILIGARSNFDGIDQSHVFLSISNIPISICFSQFC